MQFYVSRFGLAIATEAVTAAGACATAEDSEIVVELFHFVIKKGRFCPFWKMPIVSVCEALLLNILTGRLHTEFMLHLQKEDNNGLLNSEEIKYQLYENDLRWVCPVENKPTTREQAMEALMEGKGLSWSDVSSSMCSVLSPRTPEGWLLQQEHLDGHLPFATLTGFEFNTDKENPSIKLTAVPAGRAKKGLFSGTDVQTVLRIPKKDLFPIVFSLDPPNDAQQFHPFQQLRFDPPSLENTDLLHTLLQTDYLMKCFSVGSDVSAKPPFNQRDCSEGLMAKLPPRLKKVLAPVAERGSFSNKTSRFWIQADEIEYNVKQNGYRIQCQIGAVKMVVRTSPQFPGLDGKLRDIKDEDPDSPESKFARDLTENYNEIAKYFPMFGRLRELCKLQILGVILGGIMEDMQNKANGEGITIPPHILRDIQATARRENESRIQQMLREVKENVGVWPSAQDSSRVSAISQAMRQEIQSQYGYVPYEAECQLERLIREKLREMDQQMVDKLTREFTEALRGRRYRGNIRQCVHSWLEYDSQDLKNLLLSAMPVPTENDLKQVIIAENKQRMQAFNRVVTNISSRGAHTPRKTCTWVPAALKVEENEGTMRMCYGGVFLAPQLKERATIPKLAGEISHDLYRLCSTLHSPTSLTCYGPYRAPEGLTLRKNASQEESVVPPNFLVVPKPIEVKSNTLIMLQVSVKKVNTEVFSCLTNALASVERGSQSQGASGGGGSRESSSRSSSGGGRRPRGGGAGGRGGGGGGDDDDGGNGSHKLWVTKALLTIAFLQRFYENERCKCEKCPRYYVPRASAEARSRAEELLPKTAVLRNKYQQTKYREAEQEKGKDISGMHVAHTVGLDLMKHILIEVDGNELTERDIQIVRECCNRFDNFDLVEVGTNKSNHVIVDNALISAISHALEGKKVPLDDWRTLEQNWDRVRKIVEMLKKQDYWPTAVTQHAKKQDYWPTAVTQRVQVLRRVVNPNNPFQNLWDI